MTRGLLIALLGAFALAVSAQTTAVTPPVMPLPTLDLSNAEMASEDWDEVLAFINSLLEELHGNTQ